MDRSLVASVVDNQIESISFYDKSQSIWQQFVMKCRRNNLSDTTIINYAKCFKLFLQYLEDNNIKNPTEDNVFEYRDYLLSIGKKASTVRLYLAGLKCFFKFCSHARLYENIAEDVKGPDMDHLPKKDYFEEEQMAYLLEKVRAAEDKRCIRDYAIISLMASCGLRDTEVVNANWEDLDSMGAKWKLRVLGKGRDEKEEFVVIPQQIKEILDDYKRTLGYVPQGSDPIFTSQDHKALDKRNRLTVRSVSRIAKNRFIEAGFDSPRLTAHSLRRTTITLALKNGELLESAQQCARHKNLATTMIYNNALVAENNTVTQTVADAIFK